MVMTMGFDLSNCEDESYFRWNIWGFPPIRFLGEIYGWVPMGTTITDSERDKIEDFWYDTNDGQVVCEEDASNWAEALTVAIKDLEITDTETKGRRIDDDYMVERTKIWNKEPDAIKRYFDTKEDIEYVGQFITFLEKGAFYIF